MYGDGLGRHGRLSAGSQMYCHACASLMYPVNAGHPSLTCPGALLHWETTSRCLHSLDTAGLSLDQSQVPLCCAAMGDSELDGTGIETSLNGRLRLTVHKAGPSMPQFLHNLSFPLLENENE